MNNKSGLWVSIVSTICIIILALFNIFSDLSNTFFEISISTCLTALIAIWLSFTYTQKRIDTRSQKETLVHLLNSIRATIEVQEAYRILENTTDTELTMRNRNLNNYVDILARYADRFNVKDEVGFVKEHIKEYTDMVGEHLSDKEYLSKSERELRRPLDLVSSKIYDIMMKLYD